MESEQKKRVIELCLIRHGQTNDNISKTLAGHTPGKLTPLGERQAKATGEFLQSAEFDYAYVSDLGRTVATFHAIHKEMTKKIREDRITFTKQMREKGGGEFEGKPLELFRQTAIQKKIPLRQFHGKGGENWDHVNARVRELFLTLAKAHLSCSGEGDSTSNGTETIRILGVSHGGFIMETHNVIEWMTSGKEPNINNVAKNCSIHRITITLKDQQKTFTDLSNIQLSDIEIIVTDRNNDSHCANIL